MSHTPLHLRVLSLLLTSIFISMSHGSAVPTRQSLQLVYPDNVEFDSDGDGILDHEERALGSEPFDADSVPNSVINVSSASALISKIKEADPGDIILVEEGDYPGVIINNINSSGTAESPIIIRSKKVGGAVLSGQVFLKFNGNHVVFDGFTFADGYARQSGEGVIALRGNYLRVTNCSFVDFNSSRTFNKDFQEKWVVIDGQHNRVDHCRFEGKTHHGPMVTFDFSNGVSGYNRVDNCVFKDFAYPGVDSEGKGYNGLEAIRIGTGEVMETEAYVTVENNYFEATDGDAEIISCKTQHNYVRGNTFVQCRGVVTLRSSEYSVIENNVFLAGGKESAYGVRVFGEGNIIRNNYFEGIVGSSARRAAILLPCGNLNFDGRITDYIEPKNSLVENNTIVDTVNPFSMGTSSGGGTDVPVAPIFRGNFVHTGSGDALVSESIFKIDAGRIALNPTFTSNTVFGGAELGLPAATPGAEEGFVFLDADPLEDNGYGLRLDKYGRGAQGLVRLYEHACGPQLRIKAPNQIKTHIADLDPEALPSLGIIDANTDTLSFNTSTLAMSGGLEGTGVVVTNPDGSEVAVFTFEEITLERKPAIEGDRPIILASRRNFIMSADIDIAGKRGEENTPHQGTAGGGAGGERGNNDFKVSPNGENAGGSIGDSDASNKASGGAGFGSAGGGADLPGGAPYGDKMLSSLIGGSGAGGSRTKVGGSGGGAIGLFAKGRLEVLGDIEAHGGAGQSSGSQATSGGGSGGAVLLCADVIVLEGEIQLEGGDGGNASSGQANAGGGSGGRFAAFYQRDKEIAEINVVRNGGSARDGNGVGQDGGDGTFHMAKRVPATIELVDTESIAERPLSGYSSIGSIPSSAGALVFDTDALTVSGDVSGVGHEVLNPDDTQVAVFIFDDVDMRAEPIIVGTQPIMIVSRGDLFLSSRIDVSGQGSSSSDGGVGVAGGGNGGDNRETGIGQGASIADLSDYDLLATGGAGFGGLGGNAHLRGGAAYGDAGLTSLIGGSGASGSRRKGGGAGGGAIGLIAEGLLHVKSSADILAAGGRGGSSGSHATSGGGSGGAILLKAPHILIEGTLDVTGGQGGAASAGQANGGGGSGGRIAYYYDVSFDDSSATILTNGGNFNTDSVDPTPLGKAGEKGTVFRQWTGEGLADHWFADQYNGGVPSLSEWDQDFDGDGLPARVEYALGDSLLGGIDVEMPQVAAQADGSLAFVFSRRKSGIRQGDYTVEASNNLAPQSWIPLSEEDAEVMAHPTKEGFELVKLSEIPGQTKFFRLGITNFLLLE